jgi:eukaryotic-like serine/threonine-protein kinase
LVASDLVLGRFRILERIGSGGMGVVYRAFDERLQREVAVKEIPGADSERVLREAKAAARLNHAAVVTLYEFGAEDSSAILVSELAAGEALSELARSGELTDRDVAEVGLDVCGALEHAHSRGVIHRDVKPANVVVARNGSGTAAKLMDFGIASIAGEGRLTATGEVVGTLAYMAPEQADGGDAGPEADVYSLALTLYECWAGFNPVAAATPAATARRIGRPVPALVEERPDLPPAMCATIDDCLVPQPELRPELSELAETLSEEVQVLDDERALPGDEVASSLREGTGRAVRLGVALALLVSIWALAGPAHLPGLALVVGLLCAPAVIFAAAIERALIPLLAPALGAATLGIAYPAVAGRRGEGAERFALGALGWFWLAASGVAVGLGHHIAPVAESGWTRSAAAAYHQVLVPLADPHSLAAAAAFAFAAWAMGPILRARHIALALVGAVLWAAGLTAAVRAVEPAMAATPIVALAAVSLVIWLDRSRADYGFATRMPWARRNLPGARGAKPSAS